MMFMRLCPIALYDQTNNK